MSDKIRVLVVGCGTMGSSHARAYDKLDGFELIGLVARGGRRRGPLAAELGGVAEFDDFPAALEAVRPDAASINTWPDTHASMSLQALRAGAHVFVEKPLASTVAEAEDVVALAAETGRKVVVGYILQHHPAWGKFIDTSDEPDHQALCDREQAFFLKAIRGDVDLSEHLAGAVDSLRIVLAADESIRTGRAMAVGEN